MRTQYMESIAESDRFLDELMAHIILKGGKRIEPVVLSNMTLCRVIHLIYPNGIRLEVRDEG